MRFSRRTAWESGETAWARAVAEAQATGQVQFDLTRSSPAHCGLGPAAEAVLPALARTEAMVYRPDPLGMRGAREAVAEYYREQGAVGGGAGRDWAVDPAQVCLTTSTSEAYSFLFRVLCDPGDEVLIARPSYPLFDLLAQIDDVVLREYALWYDPGAIGGEGGWSLDLRGLETLIGERTRAMVVVHPNNPTGNYVGRAEREALREICARRELALIVDEVFLDYAIGGAAGESFAAEASPCLTFVLSGLSKVCALPGMKLAWAVAGGPEVLVRAAMERLEIVADTFLSLNAPVQVALPVWLAARDGTQRAIRERLRGNLQVLDERLRGTQAGRLGVEGGWTAVLRVPRFVDGVPFAESALRRGVLVQPGELYGLPEGRCVVSLLTEPEVWEAGLRALPV